MRGRSLSSRLDPGWLFVAAGLVLCAAGILVPARQSVEDLQAQLTRLEQQHALNRDRLQAHQTFLDRLRHRDPSLMRRLAAAQLNLVPAGTTPVLIASTRRATVTDWIGHSVRAAAAPASPKLPGHDQRSWLTSLTTGSGRLWVIGAGILVVFVGLLMDGRPAGAGSTAGPSRLPSRCGPHRPGTSAGVEWSGNGAEDEDGEWDADENKDLDEQDTEEDELDDAEDGEEDDEEEDSDEEDGEEEADGEEEDDGEEDDEEEDDGEEDDGDDDSDEEEEDDTDDEWEEDDWEEEEDDDEDEDSGEEDEEGDDKEKP